jgi:hypothetical protein
VAAVTEYADPDLETVAPLPLLPPAAVAAPEPPPARDRRPLAALVAAAVVVSLVIGFATATLVLDSRDADRSSATAVTPGTTPGTPGTLPSDPDADVLGGLVVQQSDVPPGNVVALQDQGASLSVATLDLCNGTYASEKNRTARRQVAMGNAVAGQLDLSTEAVLYRTPANAIQAFAELRSVVAHCPSGPVVSPVGEPTASTKFAARPDGAWPRRANVERLAYDFVSTEPATGTSQSVSTHSVAVYLRRGRVLLGLYFEQPDAKQIPVDGQSTIAGTVGVFEARMAKISPSVAGG